MDDGAYYYSQFLGGDDEALVNIIRIYKDGLVRYINGFTNNVDISEELTEDVFLKIALKKPCFTNKSTFKTWLYSIAGNVARDWKRKNSKNKTVSLEQIPYSAAAENNLEDDYLKKESFDNVRKSLCKLNPMYAQVLYLVYYERFTNSQAAIIMSKNRRQIENLLYRAKQALKDQLIKEGFYEKRR